MCLYSKLNHGLADAKTIGVEKFTLEMPAEGYEHQDKANEREGAKELVRVRHIYCLPGLFAKDGNKKAEAKGLV
jgi:hypothetical protein